jgi:hypothetical protein
VGAPNVVCLAGSSKEEVDATLPHLRGRADWIVLTPPLPDDSPALDFLTLHGRQILTMDHPKPGAGGKLEVTNLPSTPQTWIVG